MDDSQMKIRNFKSCVVWRSPCYSSYTCNESIQYAMKRSKNESEDQNDEGKLESIQDNKRRCLRSTASTNDWSKTHPQEDIADMTTISSQHPLVYQGFMD